MGLKSLFIKPVKEKPPENPDDADSPVTDHLNLPAREPLPRIAPMAAELDTGPFTEQLKDAMEKADLPGQQTYLGFSKALKNMEKLPMDESTKFQAAFATLQATGADVNQLIESFSYFSGILDAEKDKFEEALHATIGDSVVQKERRIKQLTEENNEHSTEIKKLTEMITANQSNLTLLQSELAEVNSKLKQKQNSFMEAYRMMKQQLQADAQKINMYLGSAITAQAPKNSKHKK
jgi:chromosome segregation ATPase